jgi:hypothetical protein
MPNALAMSEMISVASGSPRASRALKTRCRAPVHSLFSLRSSASVAFLSIDAASSLAVVSRFEIADTGIEDVVLASRRKRLAAVILGGSGLRRFALHRSGLGGSALRRPRGAFAPRGNHHLSGLSSASSAREVHRTLLLVLSLSPPS